MIPLITFPTKPFACLFASIFSIILFSGCSYQGGTSDDAWKTVNHEEYGFSLDIPPNWKAFTYGEWGDRGKYDRNVKLSLARRTGNVGAELRYQPIDNPSQEDLLSWAESELDILDMAYAKMGFPAVQRMDVRSDVLEGKEILRQTIIEPDGLNPDGLNTECVYVARAEDMIIICFSGNWILPEYREEFEQILKTFRPLD